MANVNPWWLVAYKPDISTDPNPKTVTFKVLQGTRAQAVAVQNLAVNGTLDGPFTTRAQAVAAEAKERTKPVAPIKVPGLPANPLGGLASIGQFFDRLTEGSTWIRVGEVVLGLALIIVGTAKLFSTTAVGRTAAKVAKIGALA